MDTFDIPIFKKSYELYKTFHGYRRLVPKPDRFTIFEQCERIMLELIQSILQAATLKGPEKLRTLHQASTNLNLIRVFIRLAKDVRAIDTKKYITLESMVDEIGRMLGGWIRTTTAA